MTNQRTFTDAEVIAFLGWACVELKELHALECPKLLEAWQAFKATPGMLPEVPSDWEVRPEKPMHSISVNHRGRWIGKELHCWDCPAVWSPSEPNQPQ